MRGITKGQWRVSLLALALVVLPAQAATTVIYDLGPSGSGTFFGGGTFTSWIPLGSLPAGSFLQSVHIDTVLDSTDADNWTQELSILFDPTPGTPGDDGLLEFSGWVDLGSDEVVWWDGGGGGAGTPMVENKYAGVDWFNDVDLNTAEVFFVNTYGTAPAGGFWSGTVTIEYGAAAQELIWTGDTSEWSTGPVMNWVDSASVPSAYVDGDKVLFDDSVGAGSRIVDISAGPVAPAGVTFNSNATYTLQGAAITGDGGLTKDGDGTLIVQNANTYSGLTRISAGTLKLDAADALPHGAGKDIVLLNGTLDLNGNSSTLNGLGGSGTVTSSVAGNVTLTLGDGDRDASFSGVIEDGSGKVSLDKIGDGTLTLNGNSSTYTGKTSVRAGTLQIGTSAYLSNAGVAGPLGAPNDADAVIDMYNGTALQLGSTEPRQNQATDRTINLAGDGPGTVSIKVNDNDTIFTFRAVTATGAGAKTLALYTGYQSNGDRESVIFSGPIQDGTDPLSLEVNFRTQTGSQSYVSLPAANTFTGPITLLKGNGGGPGLYRYYFTIGGVLAAGGNGAPAQSTLGSGQLGGGNYPGAISLDTDTILNYYSSADQTLAGVISGDGALIMAGTGTLSLTGDNSYTGDTTVTTGTLSLDYACLADGSDVIIADGAVLNLTHGGNDWVTGLKIGDDWMTEGTTYTAGGVSWLTGTGSISVIPEPATLCLLALGGLAVLKRRRKS